MSEIKKHFNQIAKKYNSYKRKNWYYYQALKEILKKEIPNANQTTILEIGCGTGELLANLNPKKGIGIDISPEMIKIAKEKFKKNSNLEFLVAKAEEFSFNQEFDYILMIDLIEHLSDINKTFQNLQKILSKNSKIIILMANPLWEPILQILEKLKLKMPEGPHQRIPIKKLEIILKKNNFQILNKGFRLILPFYIPFLSNFINKIFSKSLFFKNLGLIFYLVCAKKS